MSAPASQQGQPQVPKYAIYEYEKTIPVNGIDGAVAASPPDSSHYPSNQTLYNQQQYAVYETSQDIPLQNLSQQSADLFYQGHHADHQNQQYASNTYADHQNQHYAPNTYAHQENQYVQHHGHGAGNTYY